MCLLLFIRQQAWWFLDEDDLSSAAIPVECLLVVTFELCLYKTENKFSIS